MRSNIEQRSTGTGFSRRGFLKGAAGITFVIGASGLVAACGTEQQAEGLADMDLTVWATISSDGKVTVMAPSAEMGQGSMTPLPLLFAEDVEPGWADPHPSPVRNIAQHCGESNQIGMNIGNNSATHPIKI